MARPREFDAAQVLESAMERFWARGYELTTIKDLMESTGLTAASLYNAYGDKRALFRATLDTYIETSIGARLRRSETLPPREALRVFFDDVLRRSLDDGDTKGCMVVNSALEIAPRDQEFRAVIVEILGRIEAFFRRCIGRGQSDGTITATRSAEDLASHLLGVLMGLRVLARIRPEPDLLTGLVATALGSLDGPVTAESPKSGISPRRL